MSRSMQEFWHRHVSKNKVDVGGSVFAGVGRLGTVKEISQFTVQPNSYNTPIQLQTKYGTQSNTLPTQRQIMLHS